MQCSLFVQLFATRFYFLTSIPDKKLGVRTFGFIFEYTLLTPIHDNFIIYFIFFLKKVTSAAANGNSTTKATTTEGDKMSSTNGKSANGATNGAGAPQEG